MTGIFIAVLNMSITAACAAIIVMLARLLMKKAPKIFSYVLWSLVLFRLVCPFSFESAVSLLPISKTTLPQEITSRQTSVISSGFSIADKAVNQSAAPMAPLNNGSGADLMYVVMSLLADLWVIGMIVMLCYGFHTYFKLKIRLNEATLVRDNIYETDRIHSPFVLGFVNPKIYIPLGITGDELEYVLQHEQIHIKRRDYIIKPVSFLALTVHWFNPVIWLSFFLMNRDIELSCDESVMKKSENDIRAGYSHSLLSFSEKQSGLLSSLAFGESNVNVRIKNILSYRKPNRKTIIAAVALVAVISACCSTDPVSASKQSSAEAEETMSAHQVEYEAKIGTPEHEERISAIIASVDKQIAEGKVSSQLIRVENADGNESKSYDPFSYDIEAEVLGGEVAPHVLFNGEIGIYNESYDNPWYLQKGGNITMHVYSDKVRYSSRGNMESGYVKDGKVTSIERFALAGKDQITIPIPEDGVYQFYVANLSSDPILMEGILIEYEYPRNKNGQTYGPQPYSYEYLQPDLVLAVGIDGTVGYALAEELHGEMPSTTEEALRLQKLNKDEPKYPFMM